MRLFAGIALGEVMRAACADVAHRLEDTGFAARFGEPENFHLTLAFLGNVEAPRYDEIVATLEALAPNVIRFSLTLDKLGAFPHARHPRVIYVGAREAGSGFRSAARTVRGAYAAMGFTFEDDAVAHVTIARVKGGSRRPIPMLEVPTTTLAITELALFESIREKETTRYIVRHAAPLKAS